MSDVEWREDEQGWTVEGRAMGASVLFRLHISQDHIPEEEAIDNLWSFALAVALDGPRKGWIESPNLTPEFRELQPPSLTWWPSSGGVHVETGPEFEPARAAFIGDRRWWVKILSLMLEGLRTRTLRPARGGEPGGAVDFLLKGGEGEG
jgi:hypothetical protein